MLDEIRMTGTIGSGVRLKLFPTIPLVVAGEDHDLACPPSGQGALLRPVNVNEAVEDVQPSILGPDALPQVGGLVPVRVRRIALPQVVTQVEGEKPGEGQSAE